MNNIYHILISKAYIDMENTVLSTYMSTTLTTVLSGGYLVSPILQMGTLRLRVVFVEMAEWGFASRCPQNLDS